MLLAFWLAGSLSRPLTGLAAAAKRLGHGDLSARAGDVSGAREVEELGQSFDEMADRLERSVHAQREFVANASHQLRTPLTAMKLRLEGAIAEAPDEAVRQRLEAADLEVDRLSGIVDRLLMMAREIEEGASANVDLSEAVDRAVLRWKERAGQRDSTIVAKGDGGAARVDPTDLDQIIDNLVDNATSYAPGEVTIESGGSNGQVFVAVLDRGPGIASAGPRTRHRTLLSGTRGAVGRFGTRPGDRSTARREVGRHTERGERTRGRDAGGGSPGRRSDDLYLSLANGAVGSSHEQDLEGDRDGSRWTRRGARAHGRRIRDRRSADRAASRRPHLHHDDTLPQPQPHA